MCGIAGWFSPQGAPADSLEQLQKMSQRIAHRGPDGEGFELFPFAGFAHRRLAILGIETGRQPMFDAERQCCIVYNGEIYNFRELRERCIARGARFLTDSDTEVILQIYLLDGIAGFAELRGMFAFALWDLAGKVAYLVRDPLGIKPLFVHRTRHGKIIFGSEAKAILAHSEVQASLDEAQLHGLMNFRYVRGNGSLFRNIEQLPPGSITEWRPDGATKLSKLATRGAAADRTDLLQTIRDSVEAHLVADVEIGGYLSGGIDSATIVALAKQASAAGIRTFTVEAGDHPLEAQYAARSAEIIGVDNLQSEVTVNAKSDLADLIWHLEVPKVNGLQVQQVARHASQHVKVALSGLGADELFLGYNIYSIARQLEKFTAIMPHNLRRGGAHMAGQLIAQCSRIPNSEPFRLSQVVEAIPNWAQAYGYIRNVWDAPHLREAIYGPRMLDQELPDQFEWLQDNWPENDDPLLAIREFEWRNKMVNDLLWQEDRASMAVGLEVRVPFVDTQLKSSVWLQERNVLMPNGEKKGLLKDSVSSILPSEILRRPKSGFQVDAASFFDAQLSDLAEEYLSESHVKRLGLFKPEFIAGLLRLPQKKSTRWHYFMLYLALGAHLWLELFEQ